MVDEELERLMTDNHITDSSSDYLLAFSLLSLVREVGGSGLVIQDGPREEVKSHGYTRSSSNLCPISGNASCGVQNFYPLPTLVVFDARAINNKIVLLQSFQLEQTVDLAFMTDTWVGCEPVALNQLASLDFSTFHHFRLMGRCGGVAYPGSFLLQGSPSTKNYWY